MLYTGSRHTNFLRVIQATFRYSLDMARGWESNSAEEQAEQHQERRAEVARAVSKKADGVADAVQTRARHILELKRERILSEKTSSPVRRAALQAALQEIEAELDRMA